MISYDDNESVVKKDGIPRPLGTNGMLGAEIDNIDLMKQQKLESLNIESIVAKILPAVVKSVSANYTVKTTTSPPIINIPTTTPMKKTPTQNSMRTMHHTTVKMKYIKTVLHQSPTNRQKLSKRPTGFPSKRPTGSPFKTKTTQSSTFSVAKPHPTNLENLNMIIRGLKALGISKDIFDEKRSKLATKAPFVTSQHTTPVHPHVIALHDPKRVRILCFGDSLTAGYNNHGKGFFPYCTPLQRNLNVKSSIPVYTEAKGIVGEMTHKQMVSRLPLVLGNATYEYDWVIILGGTNDILHVKNFADDQEFMNQLETVWQPRITKDIEKLHQIAYNNGAHTLLLTVPENSIEAWPDYKPLLKMRQKINDSLRKFAQASNGKTVLCDIDKKMPRHALGPEQESKLWDDHLHMTPEGYTKMANIVAECLKPYLPH